MTHPKGNCAKSLKSPQTGPTAKISPCSATSMSPARWAILTGRDARTLPVTITSFMTNKAILWGRIAASGSLVLVPVLIFALLVQRYLVRGLSRGAIKG